MGSIQHSLLVKGPGPEFSFRIHLFNDKNHDLIQSIFGHMPWQSFLLHVVVAGETIYTPTPSLALIPKNLVPRRKGSVYYNVTGQSICFCYGIVTESALVNELGVVFEEDMDKLVNLGRLVYQETCNSKVPSIVKIGLGEESLTPVPDQPAPLTQGHDWKTVKKIIEQEVARLRIPHEPDDIQRIRLGATGALAGREKTALQPAVILQGFLATLGPHVITRLMIISRYDDVSPSLMVRMTREFLTRTFNMFEFLADVGLTRLHDVGQLYDRALDSVETLDEYREITDAMRTLVLLLFRWVHLVFPWYLKDELVCRTPEEAMTMPKLQIYQHAD